MMPDLECGSYFNEALHGSAHSQPGVVSAIS